MSSSETAAERKVPWHVRDPDDKAHDLQIRFIIGKN
jgi:hypothetical protein